MEKCRFRPGEKILSLEEFSRQEYVYFHGKVYHYGWFGSWQFRWVDTHIKYGEIRYAMPNGITSRFSDDDVIRAERRLRTKPTYVGRVELIRRLNQFDRGYGDVDDVIDRFEDTSGY